MRRAEAVTRAGEIYKRDGRCEPFERDKLGRALSEALAASGEAPAGTSLGDDFAQIVHTTLLSSQREAVWTSTDVAALAVEVLESSGCSGAAHAWRAVDRARRHWRGSGSHATAEDTFSKGRLVEWMASDASVERSVADDVAEAVERRLFASGLIEPHDGLMREWVDHELARRGLAGRVGRGAALLSPRALRERLADARPGDDVVRRAGREVLAEYAAREIYPEAVMAAHERGHIALDDVLVPGRVDQVVVDAAVVTVHELAVLRASSTAPVVVLVSDARQLVDVIARPGWADVEYVVERPELVPALLELVTSRRGRALRGSVVMSALATPGAAQSWSREESVRDTLTIRRRAPSCGVTEHAVTLNAAGLALDVVDTAGAIDRFLARVSRTALLAQQAFDARAVMAGAPAWPNAATLAAHGVAIPGPRGGRLMIAGLDVAFGLLGVTSPRAALRLARRLSATLGRLVHPAPRRLLHHFGTEDLARHPHLRDRWELDTERVAFAYDVPLASSSDGRALARLLTSLPLHPMAPLPRTVGRRDRLLHSLSSLPLAPHPCA